MYSVKLKKKASRFLKKLAVANDRKRIINAIEKLAENPFPSDAKRVEGYTEPKVFRVRVGSFRILYFVNYQNLTVYIEDIDKRERVY